MLSCIGGTGRFNPMERAAAIMSADGLCIEAPAIHDCSGRLLSPDVIGGILSRLPAVLYECGQPPAFPTTFISENVRRQFGYSSEDFYADPYFWTKQIHPSDRDRILRALSSIGDNEHLSYEYRFRRLDGEYCWLHDQVTVVRDADAQIVGLIGSWFDISQRRQLELFQAGQSQILDSLVKRRSLEETLTQIVRVMEEQNPEMVCSILRFDPATQTLRHGAAPSLPDFYNRQIDGAAIGPAVGSCGTAVYRRTRVIVTDIEQDPLWDNFRDLARQIGVKACWSQPILSSAGQVLGTFAMYYRQSRGPTRNELQLIEQAASLTALAIERYHDDEMMRHAERLVSLGTLAAGIAHEINNPIGGIQLAVQCIQNSLAQVQNKRTTELLSLISADAQRCARIVRGVLQFGRRNDGQRQVVELAEIIRMACQLTRGYATQRGALVEFSPPDTRIEVVGHAPELEQMLVNIIRNGVESKDVGARVSIQLATDSDFARVKIIDDGRGMTPQQLDRVFDPFFTTRQCEGGTGLGMSIVHGIVAGHSGTIRVQSKPGNGTSVVICLPRKK